MNVGFLIFYYNYFGFYAVRSTFTPCVRTAVDIQILVSIVVSICACHARDPGSIPGLRVFFCAFFNFILNYSSCSKLFSNFPEPAYLTLPSSHSKSYSTLSPNSSRVKHYRFPHLLGNLQSTKIFAYYCSRKTPRKKVVFLPRKISSLNFSNIIFTNPLSVAIQPERHTSAGMRNSFVRQRANAAGAQVKVTGSSFLVGVMIGH